MCSVWSMSDSTVKSALSARDSQALQQYQDSLRVSQEELERLAAEHGQPVQHTFPYQQEHLISVFECLLAKGQLNSTGQLNSVEDMEIFGMLLQPMMQHHMLSKLKSNAMWFGIGTALLVVTPWILHLIFGSSNKKKN